MSDPELATGAWRAMRALVLDLHDRRFAVSDAIGMSYLRAKALRLLLAGPLPMRELGAALLTDPPYISVMVDDLEERGLVRREVNPADRRSKLVHVTATGRAVAEKADKIQSEPPAELLELSDRELTALEKTLRKLAAGRRSSRS
jgi:DNA-binding MarR family transcriptional regulator